MQVALQNRVVAVTNDVFDTMLEEQGLTRNTVKRLSLRKRRAFRGSVIERLKEFFKSVDWAKVAKIAFSILSILLML